MITDIQTGTPPKFRRFVLAAIEGPAALLAYDPQLQQHQFELAAMTKELFHIAGQRVALPYVYDAAAVASFNCSTCVGVIPVGKGSLLWNGFDDVALTANWVIFGAEGTERDAAFEKRLMCSVPDTALCTVQGTFQGAPVAVQFGFRTYKTLVPKAMFQDYVSDMHPDVNPVSEWDDIVIELDAQDSEDNPTTAELVIEARHAVGEHLGMPRALTIAPYDGDIVILGSDVLRSASFFWNRGTGTAAVHQIRTNRGYSVYAIFCILIMLMALFYERKGALVFQATPEFYTRLGKRAVVRVLVDAVIIAGPGVALLNPHVWAILGEEAFLLVVVLLAYAYYGFWAMTTGMLMWWGKNGGSAWIDTRRNVRIQAGGFQNPARSGLSNYVSLGVDDDRTLRKGMARVTAARRANYDSLLLLAMFIHSIETRLYDLCGVMTIILAVYWLYVAAETAVLFWYLLRWNTQTTAWIFYLSWVAVTSFQWIVLWVYVYTPAASFFVQATPWLGFLLVLALSLAVGLTASISARVLLYDYWAFRRNIEKKEI